MTAENLVLADAEGEPFGSDLTSMTLLDGTDTSFDASVHVVLVFAIEQVSELSFIEEALSPLLKVYMKDLPVDGGLVRSTMNLLTLLLYDMRVGLAVALKR